MSPVEVWLEDVAPCTAALAWCHSLDGWDFETAISTGKCSPTVCDVYEEELLYLSYGRPAFRIGDKPLTIGGAWPAALLFQTNRVEGRKRMLPFDSGAWSMYGQWIDKKAKLKNFEINHSNEWAQKHVTAFFGSNEMYMLAKSQQPQKPFFTPFEVHSLVHMFQAKSARIPDNRIMAIELQLDQPLELTTDSLLAIIYPKDLDRDPSFKKFRAAFPDVEYRPYPIKSAAMSSEYHETLEQHAYEVQQKLGLL